MDGALIMSFCQRDISFLAAAKVTSISSILTIIIFGILDHEEAGARVHSQEPRVHSS